MQFEHNGISVSVADSEIQRLVLQRLRGEPSTRPSWIVEQALTSPPVIGSEWSDLGGIYAGIARGFDGGADYYLIVGPEHPDGEVDWNTMMKWAAQTGLSAPRRKEQALCFANVPELFKPEAYWSCEQHASDSGSAWGQYFDNGNQYDWGKNDKFRARLVRRLAIQ